MADTVTIPRYLARAILRHYTTLVERATVDRTDTRAANALRVAPAEIRRLAAIVEGSLSKSDSNGRIS